MTEKAIIVRFLVRLVPYGAGLFLFRREDNKEGFAVLPYINADPVVARQLADVGAAAVMPLRAPIGTNRGLTTREMLQIIIDTIDVPVVVDAGIGNPSQACKAMEMGADVVIENLFSAHPEMANLPDLGVARKILSSEYQPYACGKIFRAP